MLVGDGENGKSVFIDTLTALLGAPHVANVALQDLEENRLLFFLHVNLQQCSCDRFLHVSRTYPITALLPPACAVRPVR
jgi:hypothetical protein